VQCCFWLPSFVIMFICWQCYWKTVTTVVSIVGQWLWDRAIELATWQHPAVWCRARFAVPGATNHHSQCCSIVDCVITMCHFIAIVIFLCHNGMFLTSHRLICYVNLSNFVSLSWSVIFSNSACSC